MNDYTNYHRRTLKDNLRDTTQKLFELQYRTGEEGYEVTVDSTHKTQVIIQNHINPKNELLEDKKMLFLKEDMEHIHWGSLIYSEKLRHPYMVVTEPKYNEMYVSCLIRKANNKVQFKQGNATLNYDAIMHVGKIYIEQSYVNDTVVFAEEDKRALVIKYDEHTKNLSMFHEIVVDNVTYSVIKTEDAVLREIGSDYGVIQMVLLRQEPASLTLNFSGEIIGIMRYARLKERVYNSNARELLTLPNVVNTGDYLTYNMKDNEKRTYIVRSMVDEFEDYDRTFMVVCQKKIKFLNKNGEIVTYPVSFSDNRTKLNEKDTWFVVQDTSAVEGYIRFDNNTAQLSYADVEGSTDYVPNRFLIDGLAYRIVGSDRLTMDKLMTMKLVVDRIDENFDNLELGVADYYRFYPKEEASTVGSIKGASKTFIGEETPYSLDVESSSKKEWYLEQPLAGVSLTPMEDGTVKLYILNNIKLIGKTITLRCQLGSEVFSKDILIVGW